MKPWILVSVVLASALACGSVLAQSGESPSADMSTDEMLSQGAAMQGTILESLVAVETLRDETEDAGKLRCINTHLQQINGWVRVAEESMEDLSNAVSSGEPQRIASHYYDLVYIANTEASSESRLAHQCAGVERFETGTTEVDYEEDDGMGDGDIGGDSTLDSGTTYVTDRIGDTSPGI